VTDTTPTVMDLLPPTARKKAYVIFAVVSISIGGGLAGFASIALGAPDWLIFASSFVNVAGAGFGIVAASNVTSVPSTPAD
jgi:hypothetical protein